MAYTNNNLGRNVKWQKGFTLVEFLVVLTLLAMLSFLLVTLFANYTSFFEKQVAKVNVNLSARFVLDEIGNSTRQAIRIGGLVFYINESYIISETTLILLIPALDQNGQIIPNHADYVIFFQDSQKPKQLIKRILPGPISSRKASRQTLTNDLKEIHFLYNSTDPTLATEITIDLAMTQTERGKPEEVRDRQKITLRNFY